MPRALLLALAVATTLTPWRCNGAEARAARDSVGDVYEIVRTRESASQGDGSSGSSHDEDSLLERVIGVRSDGLELEYDLPKAVTATGKAGNWQFPARVFVPDRGPMQLLNGAELEARVDPWLHAAGLSRAACGRWTFTWNAFRIECDPQSVIKTIEVFRLGSVKLHAGDLYQDDDALRPGRLAAGPTNATFSVDLKIDPDVVRQHRAEADVVVAEMVRKPTTLDAALRRWMKQDISGSIAITFSTDADGNIKRRTKVVELVIKRPTGKSERETTTETVERRRASGP